MLLSNVLSNVYSNTYRFDDIYYTVHITYKKIIKDIYEFRLGTWMLIENDCDRDLKELLHPELYEGFLPREPLLDPPYTLSALLRTVNILLILYMLFGV